MKSVMTVAKYTFKEIYKSNIVLASLWIGLGLLVTTFVNSEFSYGNPKKIALDFGLGGSSILAIGISIFMGVTLISKEVESRTIYMILSRPISRVNYFLGRTVGMSLILLLVILIINFFSSLVFIYYGGSLDILYLMSVASIFLEALTILSVVVLFSLLVNTAITVINSLVFFFAAHFIDTAMQASFSVSFPSVGKVIKFFSYFLPNFSKINFKRYVLYDYNLDGLVVLGSLAYLVFYIASIIILSLIVFSRKELD